MCWLSWGASSATVIAHEQSFAPSLHSEQAPTVARETSAWQGVLELEIFDKQSGKPLPALVRVTNLQTGERVSLERCLERPLGWYSSMPRSTYRVPRKNLRIEACHGIETEVLETECDFAATPQQLVQVPLRRIYDPAERHLRSGNTHLHLIRDAHRKMGVQLETRNDADRYLQVVGKSDGLDLVYVSYLTRPDKEYISNDYGPTDFQRLSDEELLLSHGEEYRHNGGVEAGDGEFSYGHVMFLDLPRLIRPASIGPGLTAGRAASDGVPLRRGIRRVRADGGTVIWCHGQMGSEAIPNWIDGLLHAHNIYDGGNEGTVEEVYYPYLNAGFEVPFSTGTDWGIWDFSRVYVPLKGPFDSRAFLAELARGRSFITNGTFLELNIDGQEPGDTIALEKPGNVRIKARAVGRADFQSLQLVFNGEVVREVNSRANGRHFKATLNDVIDFAVPGWLAVRIPTVRKYDIRSRLTGRGVNILGKTLFAHTSPVYISIGGRKVFQPAAAGELIQRMQASAEQIRTSGVFQSADEKRSILAIYEQATIEMHQRINRAE